MQHPPASMGQSSNLCETTARSQHELQLFCDPAFAFAPRLRFALVSCTYSTAGTVILLDLRDVNDDTPAYYSGQTNAARSLDSLQPCLHSNLSMSSASSIAELDIDGNRQQTPHRTANFHVVTTDYFLHPYCILALTCFRRRWERHIASAPGCDLPLPSKLAVPLSHR